jgi:hypothetical protein
MIPLDRDKDDMQYWSMNVQPEPAGPTALRLSVVLFKALLFPGASAGLWS